MKDDRYLGQVAYDWLTNYYNFQWYYEHLEGKNLRAILYRKESKGNVAQYTISIVDKRQEYYDKLI